MDRFALTCSSDRVPWADEPAREAKQAELEDFGEVRFFGVENRRATLLLIVEAIDQSGAWECGEEAAHTAFGIRYDIGGCTPVVEPVDPFPDHPAAAS